MFRLRLWINRLLQSGMRGYLLIFAVATFALAILVLLATTVDDMVEWNIFYAMGINPVDDSSPHTHRWLYILLGTCGAFVFGGLMVTVFTSGVERYVERVKQGLVRYNHLRDHIVIIGWTPMVATMIHHVCRKHPHAKILILCSESPDEVRSELISSLTPRDEHRVIIYAAAQAGLDDHLPSLCLHQAKEVYLVLDDEGAQSQQLAQFSIARSVGRLASSRKKHSDHPLRINVMVNNVESYTYLLRLGIPQDYYCVHNGKQTTDIRLFNFYENWARILWGYPGSTRYDLLDFEPIEAGDKHVHLVIVGLGNMGLALLLEALRICHYPSPHPSRITVIDPQAQQLGHRLRALVPHFDAIENIHVDLLAEPIEAPAARKLIETSALDEQTLLTIAICLSSPDEALKSALALPEPVFYQRQHCITEPVNDIRNRLVQNNPRTRLLVRQSGQQSPVGIIPPDLYPRLRLFGSLHEGTDVDLLDDRLAITINGLYLDNLFARQQYHTHLEDNTIRWRQMWFDARHTPEASKMASRYQSDRFRSVISILQRHSGANCDNLMEQLAESEHQRWIAERTLAGWRVTQAGEKRLNELKLHHSIVPYNQLPEDIKQLDRNVIAFASRLANP